MKSCFKPCFAESCASPLRGDARLRQFEDLQVFHPQEDGDRRVVDAFGLPELQMPQPGQAAQGRDSLAGHPGRPQVQRVQILQARQLRDAPIRNVGLAQVENFQLRKLRDVADVEVRHGDAPETGVRPLLAGNTQLLERGQ